MISIGYIGSHLSDTDIGKYWPINSQLISRLMYRCTPSSHVFQYIAISNKLKNNFEKDLENIIQVIWSTT